MDPYRYLPFMSRQVMQAWTERQQPPPEVAWIPLSKPLAQCRVALISSAGIVLRDSEPFDQQGERDNPWWGDPSWRELPCEVTEADVQVCHLHIDAGPILEDLDVALPVRRLRELVDGGVVGESSRRHFSIMGYILDETDLVASTGPELAEELREDEVDLVLLIPV